jgi:hypothetical protein
MRVCSTFCVVLVGVAGFEPATLRPEAVLSREKRGRGRGIPQQVRLFRGEGGARYPAARLHSAGVSDRRLEPSSSH